MRHIQIALRFYPNQANPGRPSGRGVYRVLDCYEAEVPIRLRVEHYSKGRPAIDGTETGWVPMYPVLRMTADRHYKVGSRVDPAKIAQRCRDDDYARTFARVVAGPRSSFMEDGTYGGGC